MERAPEMKISPKMEKPEKESPSGKEKTFMKQTRSAKKTLKSKMALVLTSAAGVCAAFSFGLLCATCINHFRAQDIATKCGYDKANAKFKQEQTLKLSQLFDNGQLSVKQYQKELENVKQLPVSEFMKTAEISAAEKQKFEKISSSAEDCAISFAVLTGATLTFATLGFGIGSTVVAKDQQDLQNVDFSNKLPQPFDEFSK